MCFPDRSRRTREPGAQTSANRPQCRGPGPGACAITTSPQTKADTGATAPAVELEGITKRFPGVVANKDITFSVRRGTVHAIVGENGAGKSTLMKILYGVQRPDEGTIKIDGKVVNLHSPSAAIEAATA